MQAQPQEQQTVLAQFDPSAQRNGMLFPPPKYDSYVAPTPIKTSAPPRVFTEPIPEDTTRPLTPLTPPEPPRQAYDPMPTQFDVQSIEPLAF